MNAAPDVQLVRDALFWLDPGCDRDSWHKAGRAAIAGGLPTDDIVEWSASAPNYRGEQDVRAAFRGITPIGGTSVATLFHMARQEGWSPPNGAARSRAMPRMKPAAPVSMSNESASAVLRRFPPVTVEHPYIVAKGGRAEGLFVVPADDPLRIAGNSVAGWLAVPVRPLTGDEPISIQFIPPPGAGKKLNLPGASMAGVFVVGEIVSNGSICVVEGIGQAWACWRATGYAAVVTFGAGRVESVARSLRELHPAARLVLVPDAGKEADAKRIAEDVRACVATMPADNPSNFDACDLALRDGHDVLEALVQDAVEPPPPASPSLPFTRVSVADLFEAVPVGPSFWWDLLLPAGHVTTLNAHGGVGKSMLALMLACALTEERPLFGLPTRRARVAYFSAEDPVSVARFRLHKICRFWGLEPATVAKRLHILDATLGDPVLFHEVAIAGAKQGATTASYAALAAYLDEHSIDVLIVDNASDAFDANENDRARVRGFMRALAALAQPDRAVLLLAHVDKGTSRGDRGPNTEGYSGSTAWNNSARSRLTATRNADGTLTLEHHKANHGRLHEPINLIWPPDGLPDIDRPMSPVVSRIRDRGDTQALLKLLHEFEVRGEFVATATTSPSNAARLLAAERSFPKRKASEVFGLLRDAERDRLIERLEYRTPDRKTRERWILTNEGSSSIGVAPTAPTAPTAQDGTDGAGSAEGAPTAPTSAHGGVGGAARTQDGAQQP